MMVPGTWIDYSNSTGGYVIVDAKKIFEAVAYFNRKSDVRVTATCAVDEPSWRDGDRVLLKGIQISYVWHERAATRFLKTIWRTFWKFLCR